MNRSQQIEVIRHRLYTKWCGIKRRCYNKKDKAYKRYGAKGVKISKDWPHFKVFFADMAPSYFDGASIDRIDNSKGYSKENCRWIKLEDQSKNRSNVPLYTHKGETMNASDWDRKLGLKDGAVRSRIQRLGWSLEKALTAPKTSYKGFFKDSRGFYRVSVKRNGKNHFLGRYKTQKEAAAARSSFLYELVK